MTEYVYMKPYELVYCLQTVTSLHSPTNDSKSGETTGQRRVSLSSESPSTCCKLLGLFELRGGLGYTLAAPSAKLKAATR